MNATTTLMIVVQCDTEEEASQHARRLRNLGNQVSYNEGSLMIAVEVPDDYAREYPVQLSEAGYCFSTHATTYEQRITLNGNLVASASIGSHEVILAAFRHMLEHGVPKTA